jgi:hypothetical protein
VVEGESLFNDAVAMVLFAGMLSAMSSDARGPALLAQGAASFVWVSLGGLAVGAVAALLYAALVRFAEDDPLVEIALSMVLAYTAFAVADHYLVCPVSSPWSGRVWWLGACAGAISRARRSRSPICSTSGATPSSSPTASSSCSWESGATRF